MPTARVSPAERCKPACKPRVNRSRKKEKRTGRLKATVDWRQREPWLPPLSLSLWERGLPERKKKKKRRGGERNRRERSKNLSNQFNERTRAINQLLFFRREEEGKGTEEGRSVGTRHDKGEGRCILRATDVLSHPSLATLSFTFPPDAVHNAVNWFRLFPRSCDSRRVTLLLHGQLIIIAIPIAGDLDNGGLRPGLVLDFRLSAYLPTGFLLVLIRIRPCVVVIALSFA